MNAQQRKFVTAAKKDGFDLDDPADAVTLAAYVVGPNVRRIARFLGKPERWCQEPARRLRANDCWRGRYIATENGEPDGVEIAMQCGVARGWFEFVSAGG